MRLNVDVLVGREQEAEVLGGLWDKVCKEEKAPSQVCLIHGAAGSGKTSLIRHVAKLREQAIGRSPSLPSLNSSVSGGAESSKTTAESQGGKIPYFISGKFEQYKDFSSPYSEIVTAFEQLATMAPPERIMECLTTEARILGRLIPGFRKFLKQVDKQKASAEGDMETPAQIVKENTPNHHDQTVDDNSDSEDSERTIVLTMASERLIVAFQVFLREFCSAEHPIVLFADDLQWSDGNSCRLLGEIANDKSIHNFLLIGCYRDEGASNFNLALDSSIPVTELSIGPLDISDVDSLIGRMVDVPDSDVEDEQMSCTDLGQLVHRKTLGNPYFVVQFLESLHSKELLKYNYNSVRWEWDINEIAEVTDVSENVVDILRTRIEKMPPQVKRLLVIASFLGFFVRIDALQMMGEAKEIREYLEGCWGTLPDDEICSATEALVIAEDANLIELTGDLCRFSHDRIQECVYALVPPGPEQKKLHYLIGMHLWKELAEEDPVFLFISADQLNRGDTCFDLGAERIFLIEVNYKAALAAKRKVGIETVAMFVEKAVQAVHESYWDKCHSMLIDLFSLAAEVQFSRGDFDASDRYVRTVLSYSKDKNDSVRALVTRAQAHGAKRDFAQGIRECRVLLELLGVKMKRSSILSFLLEMSSTKKVVKNRSDSDLLQMKDMESADLNLAMKLLQLGSIFGWNSDTTFAGLCYFRMTRLTVEHGWCEVTPYAFSGYGFMLAALGQEKEAFRFSQLAQLSSRSELAQPDVNMMIHSFLAHFERPAAHSLPPLLAGYRAGLETGDMVCGTICMCCYSHVYLFSGLPLVSFAQDLLQFSRQLKLCRQYLALAFMLPSLQLALNLSGQTSDPMDVSVESMKTLEGFDDSMFVDTAIEDPSVLFVYYLQAFSAYLLDDLDAAEAALNRVNARRSRRLEGTQILNIFFILVDGLVSVALFRRKPKSKYRKTARASLKDLESLTKKRSINCVGILLLLRAELATLSRRNAETIKMKYDDAITQLTRSGFVHYAAMANELAGIHMLKVSDEDWSSYYLLRAAKDYGEWGAIVKVEQLTKKHSSIDLSSARNPSQSMAFRGRAQYNPIADSVSSADKMASQSRQSFVKSPARTSQIKNSSNFGSSRLLNFSDSSGHVSASSKGPSLEFQSLGSKSASSHSR